MKIDPSVAKQLGDLNTKGAALHAELAKAMSDYLALFQETCHKHGLDPAKVVIDFVTGEVRTLPPSVRERAMTEVH